jgi:hypothetical protein
MYLAEIRQKTTYKTHSARSVKDAVQAFAVSIAKNYPIALTLTIKQTRRIKNANGVFLKSLDEWDCEGIARRFTRKLNREVFGKRGAEKYGKALDYFVVMEGGRNGKNLHLHLAIGAIPNHVKLTDMEALVFNAKQHVAELDEQYKVDLATNSGWMEYITKEVGRGDSDNVLWQLA